MRCATLVGSLLVALLAASVIRANTITVTSDNFSFAYGATSDGANVWTNTENTGSPTTPTAQGDFTFAPAPIGTNLSSDGPTFAGRVLDNGIEDGNNYVGNVKPDSTFAVPITASYIGTVPVGATDYGLKLEITKISIYGAWRDHPANTAPQTMAWDEVTPDHLQTSSSIALPKITGYYVAANYAKLEWTPTSDTPLSNYSVSLAAANDTFTRTFDILNGGSLDLRAVDGIEIEGRVTFTYNSATPEPGTLVLLISGLIGLLAYAWRRGR